MVSDSPDVRARGLVGRSGGRCIGSRSGITATGTVGGHHDVMQSSGVHAPDVRVARAMEEDRPLADGDGNMELGQHVEASAEGRPGLEDHQRRHGAGPVLTVRVRAGSIVQVD